MTFSVDTDLNRILELINDNIIESSNFINDSNLNTSYLDSNSNATSNILGIIDSDYGAEQIILIDQKDANDVKDDFTTLVQSSGDNLSNLTVDDYGLIYAEHDSKRLYDLRHFTVGGNTYYDKNEFVPNTDILKIKVAPVKSDYSDNYLRFQLFKELEQKSDNEITTTTTTTILDKYIDSSLSSTYRTNIIDDLITLITDIKDNYGVKLKFFIECAKHYYHINLLLKSNVFIKNILASGTITFDPVIDSALFTSLQAKINNLKLNTESISSEYEQTIQ